MSTITTPRIAPLGTLLRLGRVSNLPTVWTNVLAATAIAGGDLLSARTASVALAMTLFYIGGMYLNDAFDRSIDARERPSRPIPAGEIAAESVFIAGFGLIGSGVVLLALHGAVAAFIGLALAAAIVAYDLHHKGNRFSPVVMGLCRALVYAGAAAAAVDSISIAVVVAGAAMLAHVVGLTYAAKQESLDRIEHLWPLAFLALPLVLAAPMLLMGWTPVLAWIVLAVANVTAVDTLRRRLKPGAFPRAVSNLIAGISLVDALMVAAFVPLAVPLCWLGYGLTRAFQRAIPGT